MRNKLILGALAAMLALPAQASEPCTDAKDMVRVAKAFYAADAELTDVITGVVNINLKGINGAPTPSHMLYRHDGEEARLDIVDGEVMGFEKAANWSKDGEICRLVDGELAEATEDDSVEANLGFSFPYKRTDGQFTIDEIREGAKDGSKMSSGMAPKGLGFAVPGLKSIQISPEEDGPMPSFTFMRKGEIVDVASTRFNKTHYVRLKDIKSSKADTLSIEGPYQLSAFFKFDPEELAEAEIKRAAAETEAVLE